MLDGAGASSLLFRLALRQARLVQAFDEALVSRVEGRIVAPVDARPGLHGEAGIDFLQLGGGVLRLLVMPGPGVGGGEAGSARPVTTVSCRRMRVV
jgi:hypothetical protein